MNWSAATLLDRRQRISLRWAGPRLLAMSRARLFIAARANRPTAVRAARMILRYHAQRREHWRTCDECNPRSRQSFTN